MTTVTSRSPRAPSDRALTSVFVALGLVLGGGIVPGSGVLVGGDSGIGKSTLLLQMAAEIAQVRGGELWSWHSMAHVETHPELDVSE